jgi:hypothetical protein
MVFDFEAASYSLHPREQGVKKIGFFPTIKAHGQQ